MYIDLVVGLNFAVDLLLLMGANALAGFPISILRTSFAAALGGIYAGICLLPGFLFLGNLFWRLVTLVLMVVIAFGLQRSAIRRGILFVFLSMALGGMALGIGNGGMAALITAAIALVCMCLLGFRGRVGQHYASVSLRMGQNRRVLTALYDTGNTLTDPVTGRQVLVVGSDVAKDLMGLSQKQLSDPFSTMIHVPGLRLIPYRAVGQPGGMLLAAKMDEILVDGRVSDMIVAFAPDRLGNGEFSALAGGIR